MSEVWRDVVSELSAVSSELKEGEVLGVRDLIRSFEVET